MAVDDGSTVDIAAIVVVVIVVVVVVAANDDGAATVPVSSMERVERVQ